METRLERSWRAGATTLLVTLLASSSATGAGERPQQTASEAPGLVVATGTDAAEPPEEPEEPPTEPSLRPLVLGCEWGTMGLTTLGVCHDRSFYGPLYLGNLFDVEGIEQPMTVVGLGQVGLVHLSSFTGLSRVGLLNAGKRSTALEVGLVNWTSEEHTGAQIAGVFGYADAMTGLQVGAIAGASELRGVQLGGIVGTLDGAGIEVGVITLVESLRGVQVGMANVSERASGLVLGAAVINWGEMNGVSLGAIYNVALGNVFALQMGAYNHAGDDLEGVQLGAANFASENDFAQVGALNLAESVQGLQLGLVNFTTRLGGVQVGAINISLSGGLPVMVLVNPG